MKNGSKNKTHIVELLKELSAKMHNKDLLNIYLDKFLEMKISRQRICLHIFFFKTAAQIVNFQSIHLPKR